MVVCMSVVFSESSLVYGWHVYVPLSASGLSASGLSDVSRSV